MNKAKLNLLKSIKEPYIEYDLNINSTLENDWEIIVGKETYFKSRKAKVQIDMKKTKVMKIIGLLMKEENKIESTNKGFKLIGLFGFINDELLYNEDYKREENIIKDRLSYLDIKDKDLIIGNLYERDDGTRFIYLGVRYISEKKVQKKTKEFMIIKSLSKFSPKKLILEVYNDSTMPTYLTKKNKRIRKDLGENTQFTNEDLEKYIVNLSKSSKIYLVLKEKEDIDINFNLEEINYIDGKEPKHILKQGDTLYKYLRTSTYRYDEGVSGRPLKEVKQVYKLYQRIYVEDNKIIETDTYKNILISSESWYGSSTHSFEVNHSVGSKTYIRRAETLKNYEDKIYKLDKNLNWRF